MARITLRQLLDHAAEHGYGVPAFNINNMEQGLAIMEAAAALDAPVIIQASRGARSYANDIMLSKMIDALEEMYPQIPLCMHQDHGNEEATCATAIKHGFCSIVFCILLGKKLLNSLQNTCHHFYSYIFRWDAPCWPILSSKDQYHDSVPPKNLK